MIADGGDTIAHTVDKSIHHILRAISHSEGAGKACIPFKGVVIVGTGFIKCHLHFMVFLKTINSWSLGLFLVICFVVLYIC